MLRQSGLIVYLRTSVAQQLRRLGRDKTRPLLQTRDRRERLERLAKERNPLYEDLADIDFPARNRSPDIAAQALADLIRAHCAADGPKPASLKPERASP